MRRLFFTLLLPFALVASGAGVAAALVNSAPTLDSEPARASPPLVETVTLSPQTVPARVEGTGVVKPSRELLVVPEVGGKILGIAPGLVPGGRVQAGELLVRVDPRQYDMAIAQEDSRVESARRDLAVERGRATIAEHEWELLAGELGERAEVDSSGRELVLRKPQIKALRSGLRSAQNGLARAKLDRRRTRVRAPFNAAVLEESVEVGQVVQAGSQLATLIGTDVFWVQVALPLERLALVTLPQDAADGLGSRAVVTQVLADGTRLEREGRVARLISELDNTTRTAQVMIEIADPLDPPDGGLPLLPGAFVEVTLAGPTLAGVYAIPREAIVGERDVWVVDGEQRLRRRSVQIAWRDREFVYATSGLEAGARVLASELPYPIDGMEVRAVDRAPEGEVSGDTGVEQAALSIEPEVELAAEPAAEPAPAVAPASVIEAEPEARPKRTKREKRKKRKKRRKRVNKRADKNTASTKERDRG